VVAPVFGEQSVFDFSAMGIERRVTHPMLVASQFEGDVFAVVLGEAKNGLVLSMLGAGRVDDPSASIFEGDAENSVPIFTNYITVIPRAVVVYLHFRGEDADMDLLDFGRVAWICTILAGWLDCFPEFSVPLRSSCPSWNIIPDRASVPAR